MAEKNCKAHPIARGFAVLGCILFIVLGILFFPVPLSGLAEKPWMVTIPLTCLLAVVYFGKLALTGRAPSTTLAVDATQAPTPW